jgi:hypothetical protein
LLLATRKKSAKLPLFNVINLGLVLAATSALAIGAPTRLLRILAGSMAEKLALAVDLRNARVFQDVSLSDHHT